MRSVFFTIFFVASILFANTEHENRGVPSSVPGSLPGIRGSVMFFENENKTLLVEQECKVNNKKYITEVLTQNRSAGQAHAQSLCSQLIQNSSLISKSELNGSIVVTAYNSNGTKSDVNLCISTCGILDKKGNLDKQKMLKKNNNNFGEFFCSNYPCTKDNIEPLRILSFHCLGNDGCSYRELDKISIE